MLNGASPAYSGATAHTGRLRGRLLAEAGASSTCRVAVAVQGGCTTVYVRVKMPPRLPVSGGVKRPVGVVPGPLQVPPVKLIPCS